MNVRNVLYLCQRKQQNDHPAGLPADYRRNKTNAAMDKRTLTRDEALELVRRYKRVISPRFDVEPKVMMFGSYSKGYANPDSDIDVAVIVPTYGDRKFENNSSG